MLLEKLRQYSDRLPIPPPMYLKSPIRWLIDLDEKGNLIGFISTATESKAGRPDRGKEYDAPHIGRSSGIRAKLLADTGEYVLGVARDKAKKKAVEKRHHAFVEEVRACANSTKEEAVETVLRFLERLVLSALSLPKDFDPSHNITFRMAGTMPIHLKSVQNFWASKAKSSGDKGPPLPGNLMECLICGELREPVKRLQFKIKGIPGPQRSGLALISANVPAFESYGLEASLIAPTCHDCGERFSKATNALIKGENTHITIRPLVYVFWTKEECEFSFASLLSRPEPGEVKKLIDSARSGRQAATEIDSVPFYATAFSASGGRVVVRDWIDSTVGAVRQNLALFFALQQIVERDGREGNPYGLFALAASTVRDANREMPPNVPKVLLHIALNGGPLPMWLLFQAVKRNRAEQGVTRNRAALIKMVLLSQHPISLQEDTMAQIDPDNTHPAYLCGRLLAVLESVQYAAIPGAGTTITDRFFGTASSAPALVFGRLLRGAQAHLGKLRRERPGTYGALQKRLEEVQANLTSYPKTLTLEQQGLFALGYYHQRAADRSAAIAYKQSKEGAEDVIDTE